MRNGNLYRRRILNGCLAFGWTKAGLSAALIVLALFAGSPVLAQTEDLGAGELEISGNQLTISPVSQTVPFDTSTIVETQLVGYDSEAGSLPPDMRVVADFSGPEINGILELETLPNEPFSIPRLRLEGEYQLSNIRLLQGDQLLTYAEPRDAAILVTQILITSVSSRALTLDEIRSYGIVISDDSFQAFNLTFGFAVDGEVIYYDLPVFQYEAVSGGGLLTGLLDEPKGAAESRFEPPQMAPFRLTLQQEGNPPIPRGGCPMASCWERTEAGPPLVGVILFPADIRLLHQFFSVVLMTQNGAPDGDPLTLRDMTAQIQLPPGLRQAETSPPTPLGVPVPIRVPGPDGELGTPDDLTFIIAQAVGEAEFLVEGLAAGTHIVEFDIEGVLEGMPTGIQLVSATAQGAVVVRDPSLSVNISHPDIVRTDEEYSLYLTVSNIGNAPVNLLSLELPTSGLSGVSLLSANVQTIPELLPGDSGVVEFRLLSQRTGKVVAASTTAGSVVQPHFEFSVGVGDAGIPLSPDTLVLPQSSEALPDELHRAALGLIGLGHSLSTAPLSLLGDLPRVGFDEVSRRVYRMTQAGLYLNYGDDPFDTLAVLASEWNGVRDRSAAWDELRRITDKGGLVADELSKVFTTEAQASSGRDMFDRFAEVTYFLPPQQVVAGVGSGATVEVESLTGGELVRGPGLDSERVRELPFGEILTFGQGEMALLSVPEAGGYRAVLRDADGGSSDLHLLVPEEDGSLRVVRWLGVDLSLDGSASVEFKTADSAFELSVDSDGDGIEDETLAGAIELLTPRPFQALVAQQNASVDTSGHVVDVLFSADIDLATMVPVSSDRFQISGKLSNGGLIPSEEAWGHWLDGGTSQENPLLGLQDTRIVRVVFDSALSPFVTHELSVLDLGSVAGDYIALQVLPVETTIDTPGIQVEGSVIGSDGEPVPFAAVSLYESDVCVYCGNNCQPHRTASVFADAQGQYAFDYVRATECGELFEIRADDPVSDKSGTSFGSVREIGTTQQLDIVMIGRGRIEGQVLYDDGTVPMGLEVIAYTPAFNEGRIAYVDAEGNYEVGEVLVGTVTLSAKDAEGNFVFQTVEVPSSGAVVTRDLTMLRLEHPIGEARGTVYEADAETPVYDAFIALYVDAQLVGVRRSAIDGTFDFGPVPAGVAEIEAFHGTTGVSGGQLFFEIAEDQIADVDIILLDERGTVQGFVYRQDTSGTSSPVVGAVVAAGHLHTVTDASGFYTLDGVFAGNQRVLATDLEAQEQISATVTVTDGVLVDRDFYFVDSLPQGGITGEVLDFDGTPVAGAVVHLAGDYYSQVWHHTAYTDNTGFFTIPDLSPGRYGVHASLGADGALQWAEIRFQGDTPYVTVQFRKGTIRGQTLAEMADGSEVGVLSQIVYRHVVVQEGIVGLSWGAMTIETDGDGFFEIADVLVGPYELQANNAFHGIREATGELIQHGEIDEHELVFRPNGTITGVVYDHDGEAPAVGATVNLVGEAFELYDVETDEEGRFTFALVPPGYYQIDAHFEQGVVFRQEQVWASLKTPGEVLEIAMTLPRQGTVYGWVDDANGYPVPGAVVTLHERNYPYRTIVHNADGEGNFQFDNIFTGPVTVDAQAPLLGGIGGKDNATVTFEGEQVLSIVTLEAVGEIAGTVLSPIDGSIVTQASVQLYNFGFFDSVTSDSDGEFRFRLLPLGSYYLKVFDPRTGRNGISGWLEVAEHNEVITTEVFLEVRGIVDGHLTEASGAAVPGATVKLRTDSLVRLTTFSSADLEGYFDFPGIPEGDFTLSAEEPFGRRSAYGSGTVEEEGATVTVDLVLEQFGSVTGSILNPPGATPGLFPSPNTRIVQNGVTIGATTDNPFVFDGVLAGSFDILADEIAGLHTTRGSGALAEEGGSQSIDLTMQAVGSMTISVFDSFGAEVLGADVNAEDEGIFGHTDQHHFYASTGSDHAVTFAGVRQGSLWADAFDPQTDLRGSTTGELLLDGEEVELTVNLEPSGWVRGVVLLSDGVTPAFDATVVLLAGSTEYHRTAEADGSFEFTAIPLGAYTLIAQEYFGLGSIERFTSVDDNGQEVDLGVLVLDDHDPQVLAIDPPAGAQDVLPDAEITITFSEPIWSSRYSSWVTLRKLSGSTISAALSWSPDETTLTLTPNSPLANATAYEIEVGTELIDQAGRHLNWPVSSSFTTADLLPPAVIDVQPADGAVEVPVDEPVHILFSEPVTLESLSGTSLQLTDLTAGTGITTTFQLLPGEREVLLTPIAAFENDRLIQLTVQNVADLVGNVMTVPVTTTFWTPDVTLPQITLVEPAEGQVFTAGDAITASANASDNRGVERVDFAIGDWQWSDASSPYAQTLIAPFVPGGGPTELTATVVDIFGNETVATRSVEIELPVNGSPPVVDVLCFNDGDWIQPAIELPFAYAITDDQMIESYALIVDGQVIELVTPVNQPQAAGTFYWTPAWDTPLGTVFEVRIEARDFAGNVGAKVVTLTVPADGLVYHDQVLNQSQNGGGNLILGEGTFTIDDAMTVTSLTMLRGSKIITRVDTLVFDSSGPVRLGCASVIDVDGSFFDLTAPSLDVEEGEILGSDADGSEGGVLLDIGALVLERDARIVVGELVLDVAGAVTVRATASIVGDDVELTAGGVVTVDLGGLVDVSGRGYAPGAPGEAPEWVVPAMPNAGGSHGGSGSLAAGDGPVGEVYDSVYNPQLAGGGGTPTSGNGGGVLKVEAAEIVLDGQLLARGTGSSTGAGAGGTVHLTAQVLRGGGSIDAAGGDTGAGTAGGGRVALWVDDLSLFDPRAQTVTRGGQRGDSEGNSAPFAAPGTLYYSDASSSYGVLVIDGGKHANGADRSGGVTELPALGSGQVTAFTAEGLDARLGSVEPFRPRWSGAWIVLLDAAGGEIGAYRVLAIDAAGQLLAEGAASASAVASYRGEYRFDEVVARNAGIAYSDAIDFPGLILEGQALLAESVTLPNLTVRAGANVRPATGDRLHIEVPGTLTVEAGGAIDVTALGYGQDGGSVNGASPTWVSGSLPDAGGSHGGPGADDGDTTSGGEVFDSVYYPQLPGGGGAEVDSGDGRRGGGVLELVVGTLDLDGELLAVGEWTSRNYGGSGAGGSVLIEVATIQGSGSIVASGGYFSDPYWWAPGVGGGGRIALYADDLTAFDPESQLQAFGGHKLAGGNLLSTSAPGTVFFKAPEHSYGILVIDNGSFNGQDVGGPATELPVLGGGSLSALEAAGGDAWITATEVFRPRWHGAWMTLIDAAGVELGSYRVSEIGSDGRVLLAGAGAVSGATTYQGEYRFDEIKLLRGTGLIPSAEVARTDVVYEGDVEVGGPVVAANVTVKAGATVRPIDGTSLVFDVSDTLTVEAGGVIDVTGYGFGELDDDSGTGGAPEWVSGSVPNAGGSHGGTGVADGGTENAGDVYGSVYAPSLAGAGGAEADNKTGQAGGGIIQLSAATLVLDGELRARGAGAGRYTGSGGAGGSILVDVGSIQGSGLIDASGGDFSDIGFWFPGVGGGGRVALYADDLGTFDPESQLQAVGGYKVYNGGLVISGAPGTVLYHTPEQTYGVLLIDNGTYNGADAPGPSTELPELGSGSVTALEVAGADAWVSAVTAFWPRWQGAWMSLSDASGSDLGSFEVIEVGVDGRLLLAGAGGAAPAANYQGEYRFDEIRLLRGAGVVATDPVIGVEIVYEGEVEVSGPVVATNVTVKAGATVRPAAGTTVVFDVSDTLTIEAGGAIDATGLGFGEVDGGSGTGTAPDWVAGSVPNAGGSHGGTGVADGGTDNAGDVYGSVYSPSLGGAGGAEADNKTGQAGGGVIQLSAATLVLDGDVLARGVGATRYTGSGGSGGAIRIDVGVIQGDGLIDVSGGDFSDLGFWYPGVGGAGRVALYADTLGSFDPGSQIKAIGGYKVYSGGLQISGAAGTILYRTAAQTYGVLTIDNGTYNGSDAVAPATELPMLGSGAVASFETAGSDAWLGAAEPFWPRWEGAWTVLVDDSGTDLGSFAVAAIGGDGRLLLAGASAVTTAASYRGEYRFDEIRLLHGAGLDATDPIIGADVVLEGDVQIEGPVVASNVTVKAGASVQPVDEYLEFDVSGDFTVESGGTIGGRYLTLNVGGTMTIEAGGAVDATGFGSSGGVDASRDGEAPEGISVSVPEAGGSHGGQGSDDGDWSKAGESYDSVYWPQLPGGGGSYASGSGSGQGGGGAIRLTAANLVLEGELASRGESSGRNDGSSGGGGAIWIETGSITGAGLIDASGGSFYDSHGWWRPGAGGGGRVVVLVDDWGSFDPENQIKAWAGHKVYYSSLKSYAAPGTVLYKTALQEYGVLVLDGGVATTGQSPTDALVELPSIYKGSVGATVEAGDDLWIEPLDPAQLFSPGVAGAWARIDDVDYRVIDEKLDRRQILLEGAASGVAVGDLFIGLYKFDQLVLRRGTKLTLRDDSELGAVDVDATSELILLDVEPPAITNFLPVDGALIEAGELVMVSADVSDDFAVTSVTFRLGGQEFVDDTAPYAWSVSAPAVTEATAFAVEVEAVDAEANLSSVEHTITVEPVPSGNPPAVTMLCPSQGALLAPGTGLDVAVDAIDDHAVARVEFVLAGQLVATLFAPPWVLRIEAPPTAVDGDVLTLAVVAYDFADQSGVANLDFGIVEGTVVVGDTFIGSSDTSLDGTSVVVTSGTLEFDGAHALRDLVVLDGAQVTHKATLSLGGEVGYWPFDDQADPSANSTSTGTAQLGSLVGTDDNDPMFTCDEGSKAPIPGNACGLDLTGLSDGTTGDFTTVANHPDLDFTEAYTLSAWVRIDSGADTYRPIFFRGANDDVTDANDIEVYRAAYSNDLLVLHNRDNGGTKDYVGFSDPPADQFFHLAVTYDGSTVRAYYDGVEQSVVNQSSTVTKPLSTGRDWLFGKVSHSDFGFYDGQRLKFLDGAIDEVRLYDRGLSGEEVAALAAGSGPGAQSVDLTLERDLFVACGGAIDASGKGYAGGDPRGLGFGGGSSEGAGSGIAGSHGGRGGNFDGSGRIYGSLFDPRTAGAGGGGPSATAGGGVVRIAAGGDVTVDGAIRADGGGEDSDFPHGAGGSIRLDATAVKGRGTISAAGSGSATAAAGGGGRVAVYAATFDATLRAATTARGGASADAVTSGAAGTAFVRLDSQSLGSLTIDNGTTVSSQITELPSVGSGTVTAVGADAITDDQADFLLDLKGIDLAFNGNQAELWPIVSHLHHGQVLTVDTASPLTAQVGDLYQGIYRFDELILGDDTTVVVLDSVESAAPPTIGAGASLETGYEPTVAITSPTDGETFQSGANVVLEADVDDVLGVDSVTFLFDGVTFTGSAPPFSWQMPAPLVTAPTVYPVSLEVRDQGGHFFRSQVDVTVQALIDPNAPTVVLGACPAEGDLVSPSADVVVSFDAADNDLLATYSLVVDGVAVETVAGVDLPEFSGTMIWSVPIDATPGASYLVGVEATDYAGNATVTTRTLAVPAGLFLVGDQDFDDSYDGQALILGPGIFTATTALSPSSLRMIDGASLTGFAGGSVELDVSSALHLQCGAVIDVAGLGYAPGTNSSSDGTAPAWVVGSKPDAGGSHGGIGIENNGAGPGGGVYDSVYQPTLAGGGGADGGGSVGLAGGGVIDLVAETMILDGELRARGLDVPTVNQGGGGGGGTVRIRVSTIRGLGLIDASGGDYYGSTSNPEGAGGGGRIAIHADSLSDFDPLTQTRAWGGYMKNGSNPVSGYAAAGTVLYKSSAEDYGVLIVDSGEFEGVERSGAATELPSLGTGAVTATEVANLDLWVSTAAGFWPRWAGAWMVLLDSSGEELGTFEVLEIDPSERSLLLGAGAFADVASYRGEYRFDGVRLLRGGGMFASDDVTGEKLDLVFTGETELSGVVHGRHATVVSDAVVRPIPGMTAVSLELTGTLTVEAGALIDATGYGYLPGNNSSRDGQAPEWVAGSVPDAGGSHGGHGMPTVAGYLGGDVYDSVYLPALGGGGGSDGAGGSDGGTVGGYPGGGVIDLVVETLVLDGELRARGVGAPEGSSGGAGGGGTVRVVATTVQGSGLVDVTGGDYYGSTSSPEGSGGGGRIAIHTGTFVGFDPVAQTRAWGGYMKNGSNAVNGYAAPGTVLFRSSVDSYGVLLIDRGEFEGADRWGPATELPALGAGLLISTETVGADLWVASDDLFHPRWLGAWMVLLDTAGLELGTFQVIDIDESGRARLAASDQVADVASYRGEYRFDGVQLLRGGGLSAIDEVKGEELDLLFTGETELTAPIQGRDATVVGGAVLSPVTGGVAVSLELSGTLTVESGALIDVTGYGYAPGDNSNRDGQAPEWVAGSVPDAGGSHGGHGMPTVAGYLGGDVYDSVYLPELAGGGGSDGAGGSDGGAVGGYAGGGVVDISVDTLVLDGEIRARGVGAPEGSSGGAGGGGTVMIEASWVEGSGLIDVGGGDYFGSTSSPEGSGGGGRIAIRTQSFGDFDPTTQARAWGGYMKNGSNPASGFAAAGTVLFTTSSQPYGVLTLDSGVFEGSDRVGPPTLLPALGTGPVTGTESEGADLWVSQSGLFWPRWLGAWMLLSDSSGVSLGEYRVLQVDAAGRALLENAAALVDVADYLGEYRFDAIEMIAGGRLDATDRVYGGSVELTGANALPGNFAATELAIRSGALVVPASGMELNLEVSGLLTIESGATLDVTAFGYAGGTSGYSGTAPPGIVVSGKSAGGSHGGAGILGQYTADIGEVYDSVYEPSYAGGGGGRYTSSSPGGWGGGVLQISAGSVIVDGDLLALGESTDYYDDGLRAGGGAGGSILIVANDLSGSGLIDASGGDHQRGSSSHGGAGGGGRVALYVDDLSLFDVDSQARAWAGTKINTDGTHNSYAAPGTIFIFESGSAFGDFYLDHAGELGISIAETTLPRIGGIAIGWSEADAANPDDLWIEPADSAATFSLGVVGMWLRIDSVDYRIIDQSDDLRQLLLAGASLAVTTGESYEGVYKFDTVTVHGGANLVLDEITEAGSYDVDGDSQVTGPHAPPPAPLGGYPSALLLPPPRLLPSFSERPLAWFPTMSVLF